MNDHDLIVATSLGWRRQATGVHSMRLFHYFAYISFLKKNSPLPVHMTRFPRDKFFYYVILFSFIFIYTQIKMRWLNNTCCVSAKWVTRWYYFLTTLCRWDIWKILINLLVTFTVLPAVWEWLHPMNYNSKGYWDLMRFWIVHTCQVNL